MKGRILMCNVTVPKFADEHSNNFDIEINEHEAFYRLEIALITYKYLKYLCKFDAGFSFKKWR